MSTDPTPLTDPKTDEEMNASMTCKFGHGPKPEQEFESREAFNVLEDDIGYEVISGEKIPLNDEELKAFDVEGIPHFDNKGGIPHFDDNDAVVDFIFRLRATIRQRSQAAADYRRAVPLLDESGKINWPSVHDNPTILRDMLSQRDKELEETEDQLEVTLNVLKKLVTYILIGNLRCRTNCKGGKAICLYSRERQSHQRRKQHLYHTQLHNC